jgi:predicted transcriptional regulator
MEVHFSPEIETRLQQVASANGKNAEELVRETASRMLENQARFNAGVHRGIDQADRAEFVQHEEVRRRSTGSSKREADSMDTGSIRRSHHHD